jgi:serralysin
MANFTISGLSTVARVLNLNEAGEVLLNGSLVTAITAVTMPGSLGVFVNRGTVVAHAGDAVSSSGANLTVLNTGLMTSALAVVLNTNTNEGGFTVLNSGTIAGSTNSAEGVFASSGGLDLTNTGTISTLRDAGVRADQGIAAEANTIFNSGLITNSGGLSFQMAGDADIITNTGMIVGDMQMGDGANRLRNAGQIEGSVSAGVGADIIDLRGGFVSGLVNTGAGADTLTGGSADDRLVGAAGADRIVMGAGDDAASGGNDNDTMLGGTGNDVLAGGMGVDRLTGGAGADAFDFNTAGTSITGARDVILDFLRGADDVDMSTIDARAGTVGNQAFVFIGTAAFSAQGQIRIIDTGANMVVQANRSGSLAPDFEVMVLAVGTLTAADFVL